MPATQQLPTVEGQPSWRLRSDCVTAWLTRLGGHLGPVTFETAVGPIQPYSIAPWATEKSPADLASVLRPLRGDFFCAPFGGNDTPWRGERHPAHGETACRTWSLRRFVAHGDGAELTADLRPRIRPGRIVKVVTLRPRETNLYCRHELHGFRGSMCLGHHAMLKFPDEPGAGRIALSPWGHGRVVPQAFENAAQGGYSSLRPGAGFRSLHRVPRADGGFADLSSYPARAGYEDLVMVSARRSAATDALAWTTVTFPRQRYVWFALKDPCVLASTVLWHSNGGRHYPPWNGRHRGVLGLEEVTSYFHFGLAESAAANPLARAGIPTVLRLDPARPLIVRYVMGVAAIPAGFDVVQRVLFRRDHVVLGSRSGCRVEHPVDLEFFPATP